MITEQWLTDTNEEFRNSGIEPATRPWRAIEKYGNETNLPVAFSSPEVKLIFSWFENNLGPGSLNMRPLEGDRSHLLEDKTRRSVEEDLADILIYLVRISDKLEIDLYNRVPDW